MAGRVSFRSNSSQDQLVVAPESAAWLPCSATPGAGPQPTCSLPKCAESPGAQIPPGTPQFALFILTSGGVPDQSGGQGEGVGQSWPLPMPAWQKYGQTELEAGEAVRATGSYFRACT